MLSKVSLIAVIAGSLAAVGVGVAPASADAMRERVFDKAQVALGLDPVDAQTSVAGLEIEHDGTSATAEFMDLSISVDALTPHSDTTRTEDGVRVMSLLQPGNSSAEFTVGLPDGADLERSGEGYLITSRVGDGKIVYGEIETPWAVDANGKSLKTSYSYADGVLTQEVDTEGAKFPVVADPKIRFGTSDGPGMYWNLWGHEAKTISAFALSVAGLTTAGGCVVAGKMPKVGYIIQGICSFVGVPTMKGIISSVSKIFKSTKISSAGCYQIKIVPRGNKFKKVNAKNCK
ncbi:MAG TPA: hypothetical protein DEB66_03305 [Micrococcaceae bacterium]|nr:hypothetical protein [Micrococcaceae bacterium]